MRKLKQLIGVVVLGTLITCGYDTKENEARSTTNGASKKVEEVGTEAIIDLSDNGIGPVTSYSLSESIDTDLAKTGEELFNQMCSACHKPTVNFIGPAPKGIFERRSPEWVLNMILNPQEMLEKNATAKALLDKYNNVPMTDLGITEEQAKALVEFFRTL